MEENTTDKRIDELAGRVGRFEDRFERFEDKVDARFDKVDARFDKVATKEDIARLDARLDRWGKVGASAAITISGCMVTLTGGLFLKLLGV